jgi:hypothetical protein
VVRRKLVNITPPRFAYAITSHTTAPRIYAIRLRYPFVKII